MQKTRIAATLLLSMFIVITPQMFAYSGGGGTAASPYQIATPADLLQLAGDTANYDKYFILTADISLAGQGDNPDGTFSTAVIAPDTDNSSTSFVGTKFRGSFNGNGHIISDLTIDTKGIANHYLGLFGYLDIYAEITNLQLDNIAILGANRPYYVGGICGYSYYVSEISNCKVSGSITGGLYVGGISGSNYEDITQCSTTCIIQSDQLAGGICGENNSGANIIRCISTGSVTGSNDSVGAVCGENFYGTITDSYSTAAVVTPSYVTGGFCGVNYGQISRCYSTRILFCEKNWGAITDCYWDWELSGFDLSSGGLAANTSDMMKASTFKGWNNGHWRINEGAGYPTLLWEAKPGTIIFTDYPAAAYPGNGTTIPFELSTPEHLLSMSQRTCDWNKDFLLTTDIDMSAVTNFFPIANFTGTLDGQGHVISNMTINANVIKSQQQIALLGYIGSGGYVSNLGMTDVMLTGQELIGGIGGMNRGGTIDNCYVTGSVTNAINASIAGGLCGYNFHVINNCCANVSIIGDDSLGGLCGWSPGNISYSYASGSVTGRYHIGGLCGSNSGTLTDCYAKGNVTQSGIWPDETGGLCGINWKTIRNCYATGSVNGTEGDIGGICGNNWGSNAVIENCFWDIENQTGTTTEGVGANPNGGTITNVFAKTTAEMQTQTTYTDYGWSFGTPANPSIWKMPISGYPQLSWQNDQVNMEEFAQLAQYWQMTGCDDTQPCSAADWYVDEVIDINDLMQLAKSWLAAEMHIYKETPSEIFDGFETGDFSVLNWQNTGGFADWSIISSTVYEGSFAVKSGAITHYQTSTVMLTIDTTGFDTISFARKVSSEANWDFLYFYIDLVEQAAFSGELGWQVVEYPVSGGLHTFAWEYYKDGSISSGSDCAWIDNVRIYNSAP